MTSPPDVPKVPTPLERPVDVVSHTEWNLAGFDAVGGGAQTFADRIGAITAEIAEIDSDVLSLLEVPKRHLTALEKSLAEAGYSIGRHGRGRAVVVRTGMRTRRWAVYKLPTRGPSKDARHVVYSEVYVGDERWLFTAGHFEHRIGSAYDRTRVQQAKEAFAKGDRLRSNWGIEVSCVSFADDENSRRAVLEQVYEPQGYFDVFEGAWQADNESVATLSGWSGSVRDGGRIDKIKAHRSRPRRRAHVRKAAAGISDHLPTTVVYGAPA